MPDVVAAFLREKEPEGRGDKVADVLERARPRGAEERFQFGEGLFDRIEIRTVGRQESQPRADLRNRGTHLGLLVRGEVVEHDHIAGSQRGYEHLLDVGEKRHGVHRPIEHRRRGQFRRPERRHDRVRLPVAARRVVARARPAQAARVATDQIGGHARFVDKDVLTRIMEGQRRLPSTSGGRDVRAPLFVGADGFF
jgi:hypothetical protein